MKGTRQDYFKGTSAQQQELDTLAKKPDFGFQTWISKFDLLETES